MDMQCFDEYVLQKCKERVVDEMGLDYWNDLEQEDRCACIKAFKSGFKRYIDETNL